MEQKSNFIKNHEENRKKWWALHAQIQKLESKNKVKEKEPLPDNCRKF